MRTTVTHFGLREISRWCAASLWRFGKAGRHLIARGRYPHPLRSEPFCVGSLCGFRQDTGATFSPLLVAISTLPGMQGTHRQRWLRSQTTCETSSAMQKHQGSRGYLRRSTPGRKSSTTIRRAESHLSVFEFAEFCVARIPSDVFVYLLEADLHVADQRSWGRYATNAPRSSGFMSRDVIPPLVILLLCSEQFAHKRPDDEQNCTACATRWRENLPKSRFNWSSTLGYILRSM